MLVQVPLQQAVPVGQQKKLPQLPQSRLVLPLHDRQAVTHWFRRFLVGHDRQKAVHRSGLAAQAVPTSREPNTAPANTVPMPRSDSRRDTDRANNFDKSSKRSMIDTRLIECEWLSGPRSHSQPMHTPSQLPHEQCSSGEHPKPHAPQLLASQLVSIQAPRQFVVPPGHPLHMPWLQMGVAAPQTYPQAPQLCGSEFMLVHAPLQQAVPAGQQKMLPQLPQRRLVLPLHDRQAVTHWFRRFLVGHDRQKAVH